MIPFVPIKLDKVYNLRFGMGAAYEFERLTKIKVTKIDLENFSITELCQLLWVMMKQENKDLTLEQTLKLVDENAASMTEVIEAITGAITAAFVEQEADPNA